MPDRKSRSYYYNKVKEQKGLSTTRWPFGNTGYWEGQFNQLDQKTNTFRPQRVVRRTTILTTWSSSDDDLKTIDLLRAIHTKVNESKSKVMNIAVRFVDDEGNEEIKNISLEVANDEELLSSYLGGIINGGLENLQAGSDSFMEYQDIRANWFSIMELRDAGGCNIPKMKIKSKKIKIINLRLDVDPQKLVDDELDFDMDDKPKVTVDVFNIPSKNNNCLIECFRNASGRTEKACKIKEELGEKKNALLNIHEHLPKLEEMFKMKVGVISYGEMKRTATQEGEKNFPYTELNEFKKNLRKFKTSVELELFFSYGDLESDFFIFLTEVKGEPHFYLVQKIRTGKYCKNSGAELVGGQKTRAWYMIKDTLIAQGRLNDIGITVKKKPKKKKKPKSDLPKMYYFFDFETVFDYFGYLQPYSVACIAGRYIKEEYKINDEKGQEIIKQRNVFKEHGRINNMSRDCVIELQNFLLTTMNEIEEDKPRYEHKNEHILVGYNNSRFDNYILAERLYYDGANMSEHSIFIANNSILKLNFRGFKTMDLCRFTARSLKDACKKFGCKLQKQEFSHTDIQKIFFEDEKNFYKNMRKDEEKMKKLEEYNLRDVEVLVELLQKIEEAYKGCYNKMVSNVKEKDPDREMKEYKSICNYMTLSSMSYNIWKDSDNGVKAPETREVYDFFRKSIVAGRSQPFRKGFYKGGIQSLDVKSLYPFIMLSCLFPTGQEIQTDTYKKGKLGIYRCYIHSQPRVNVIPLRSKDAALNWGYREGFEYNLTSIDIEVLQRHGGILDINEGYYWDSSSDKVFQEFMNPFKNEKTRQDKLKENNDPEYNQGVREFCKLVLNALSGKMGQRIFTSEVKIIKDRKGIEKFLNTHTSITTQGFQSIDYLVLTGEKKDLDYKPKSVHPVHLMSFIYSYARKHMYDSSFSKTEKSLYTDTDSHHVPIEEMKRLQENQEKGFGKFNMGDQFGDFEGEIEFLTDRCYYIAPKCYGLFPKDPDKKGKMRFKGVGFRDKLLTIPLEVFNILTIKGKSEIFNGSPPALSEILYKKLCNGQPVKVLSSRLSRHTTIKDNNEMVSKLKQVFMVKTIKNEKLSEIRFDGEISEYKQEEIKEEDVSEKLQLIINRNETIYQLEYEERVREVNDNTNSIDLTTRKLLRDRKIIRPLRNTKITTQEEIIDDFDEESYYNDCF